MLRFDGALFMLYVMLGQREEVESEMIMSLLLISESTAIGVTLIISKSTMT